MLLKAPGSFRLAYHEGHFCNAGPRTAHRGPKAPKPLMVRRLLREDGLRRHPARLGVRGSELEIAGSFESNPTPTRADRAVLPQRPRHLQTGLETE